MAERGAFTLDDARRIAEAVRHVERSLRGGDRPGADGAPPWLVLRYAIASTSIGACSGSGSSYTLGSGVARLCVRSGASVTQTSDTFTAWNAFDKAISANALLVVGWTQGAWEIVKVRSCNSIVT